MSKGEEKGVSQRCLRVGEELRHYLARILERGELRDPELQGVSITVTEVRVSPDLRNATAYVMPLGGKNIETVVAALNRAGSFLRRQLAGAITMKYLPSLRFRADDSFSEAEHIESLLRDPRVARDLAAHDDDEDGNEDDGA